MRPEARLASIADAFAIRDLEKRFFADPWPIEAIVQAMDPGCGYRTWVSLESGRVTGYVCAGIRESDSGEDTGPEIHIANLAVDQPWRNRGIGRFLMEMAEAWGIRLGAGWSSLEVGVEREPAISLYSRLGYRRLETIHEYYGRGLDAHRMGRQLRERTTLEAAQARLARSLAGVLDDIPVLGVVLGSGLGWIAELTSADRLASYESLPEMSSPGVPGHRGELLLSEDGRTVFCAGRRHAYEGYDGDRIALLPGCLSDLGVHRWLLTSSAGSLSPDIRPGDIMVFSDHVNLSGAAPSDVPGRLGPAVYSGSVFDEARGCPGFRHGVFACVTGPAYETRAEERFLSSRGVSAVSMSTVPEALALAGRGCSVAGLAMITNDASDETETTHDEVLAAQKLLRGRQSGAILSLIRSISSSALP